MSCHILGHFHRIVPSQFLAFCGFLIKYICLRAVRKNVTRHISGQFYKIVFLNFLLVLDSGPSRKYLPAWRKNVSRHSIIFGPRSIFDPVVAGKRSNFRKFHDFFLKLHVSISTQLFIVAA